ncbi:M1 family metallopeptidase [Actinopolymorpha sp. B11F2]|uniref:M1 family metallopeptidase n=1 Tax=Actinopolymorpha sp. B11F2 TaxID=3160862 RepID=UPI0032E41465
MRVHSRASRLLLPAAAAMAVTAAPLLPAVAVEPDASSPAARALAARALAAGAPTPGAPDVGDKVYPNLGNGGYDVSKYLVDFDYAEQDQTVDAQVLLTARATQDLSRFNLDAVGLTINSVEVNGRPATFAQDGEELVITPASALGKGKTFVVKVSYGADPRTPVPNQGWVPTERGFALAPQPAGAHAVLPSNDHPSDKAHFAFRITVPEGTTAVANGTKVAESTKDGRTTVAYVSRDPIATELLQIAVGGYEIVDRGTDTGVHLRDVVPAEKVSTLEPALSLTPGHLNWIRPYLGDFPLEAYGLLPADTDDPEAFDFTGLETQTLTLYKPAFLTQEEKNIGSHMMHEMVHNWWGNSVSPASWSDLWINEGHADYYGLLYRYERGWPDARGFTTMEQRMKYTYSQGDIWRAESGPVADPNAANLFDNQRYTGGVLVLYALREKVGPEPFARIEDAILAKYRNGNVSTAQFVAMAADVSGDPSVKPFLQEWLYGTKTPPMPNHPDWPVYPVPTGSVAKSTLQTDRLGIK